MLNIFNAVVYIQNHISIGEYKEDFWRELDGCKIWVWEKKAISTGSVSLSV